MPEVFRLVTQLSSERGLYMDIKVGDIVEYKGETVRLLAIFSRRLSLTLFGLVPDRLSSLRLVESTPSPELHSGDFVIVRDISKDDKRKYPFHWGPKREGCVVSGETYEVMNHHYDTNYGDIAYVNGLYFQTYHLEKIDNYDIV